MRLSSETCEGVAEVDSLPGCSQIAVIHSAFVVPEARNKGVGYSAHLQRLERLWGEFNYDLALCTIANDNLAERSILRAAGWVYLMQFTSRKTGNNVGLYGKKLSRERLNKPYVKNYEDYLEEMEQ